MSGNPNITVNGSIFMIPLSFLYFVSAESFGPRPITHFLPGLHVFPNSPAFPLLTSAFLILTFLDSSVPAFLINRKEKSRMMGHITRLSK